MNTIATSNATVIASITDNKLLYIRSKFHPASECPVCRRGISPIILSAYYANRSNRFHMNHTLAVLFFCTLCDTAFLCEYKGQVYDLEDGHGNTFVANEMRYVTPISPLQNQFSDAIQTLSADFIEIYYQSQKAESEGLSQICGMGYRKALEFLVKDYLCHKFSKEADKIVSESLGSSIKRIEDERIRTLASRSAWIGNDETHYMRKHENLGIVELKMFISSMVCYIDAELSFEQAYNISGK